MDGARKSILFFEVAGIMLHSGLFSELVVDDAAPCLLTRELPARALFFPLAFCSETVFRRIGEGRGEGTLRLFVVVP